MALKKYPSSKVFKKELEGKKLSRLYLFMGEEEGEKDKFIQKILDLTFQNSEERNNSTGRFHIENDEFLAAADFALSQSMFSSTRVCIMRNIESLKSTKNNKLIFKDIMENLPDDTSLIMTTIKNRPPDFIPAAFLDKTKVVQFWKFFDNDIYNYIKAELKKTNLNIEEKALNLLIELTGKDIKKIDDALEMIKYSGQSDIITQNTIADLIHDVRNVSVYDFIDSLFKKQKRALHLFKKTLEEGTPEGRIFYEITRQVETLERYYILIEEGNNIDEAIKKCGIYSKNRDNFLSYTRLFPADKVKKIFKLITKADYKRKSGSSSKELVASPLFNLITEMLIA